MIYFRNLLLFVLTTILSFSAISKEDGHHDEHGHDEHQEEKITAPFEVAPHVQKNFGITTLKAPMTGLIKVPKDAVVISTDKKFLYRIRDGKFMSIQILITRHEGNFLYVKSDEIAKGDLIAITGVAYIKTIETSLTEEGGEGHGH